VANVKTSGKWRRAERGANEKVNVGNGNERENLGKIAALNEARTRK
jgi:hypothetical protein